MDEQSRLFAMDFKKILLITSVLSLGCVGITDGMTYIMALLGRDSLASDNVITDGIKYELLFTFVSVESIGKNLTISGAEGIIYNEMKMNMDPYVHVINNSLALNGSELANKTIIATLPVNFTLQVFITADNYLEAFTAIPIEHLDGLRQVQSTYEYIVSTFCATGGYCQFAIAALQNETIVSVKIPGARSDVVFCVKENYFRGHRDTRITLDQFESAQIESPGDLTGTRIYSYSPIVVFAGSRNVSIDGETTHSVEQLLPASQWDTEYIVHTLGDSPYGDVIKISTSWVGTEVEISGYKKIKVTKPELTIQKRLSQGSVRHIKASSPIQVTQITGVQYVNVSTGSPTFGMTIVPGVHHGVTEPKVGCSRTPNTPGTGNFQFVSPLLEGTGVNNNISYNEQYVDYTDYKLQFSSATEETFEFGTTNPMEISGILTCEGSAFMAFGAVLQNVTPAVTSSPESTKPPCIEGRSARTWITKRDVHSVILTDFSRLKLRVRVCGTATIKFYEDEQAAQLRVLIRLSGKHIQVFTCSDSTCTHQEGKEITYDNAPSCSQGMRFYWFDWTGDLCIGGGPFPDPGNCDVTFPTGPIQAASMMGEGVDADFSYDLETTGGCSSYEPSWRCEDTIPDCRKYGTDFCTRSQDADFAKYHCPKHCGKCTPDSYGRAFKVLLPISYPAPTMTVYVTGMEALQNVAVGDKEKILPYSFVTDADRQVLYFSVVYPPVQFEHSPDPVVILSDTDVSVTMMYKNDVLRSFSVYPTDAYHTEHMLLTDLTASNAVCALIADRSAAQVIFYGVKPDFFNSLRTIKKTESFTVSSTVATIITSSYPDLKYSGQLFISDQPITIFCGSKIPAPATKFTQMLPMTSIGKHYSVPAMTIPSVQRPFNVKLHIMNNYENTAVIISDGFDARHILLDRGTVTEQPINAESSYQINATRPVTVGACFTDPSDPSTCVHWHLLFKTVDMADPATSYITLPNSLIENEYSHTVVAMTTFFTRGAETATVTPASLFYRRNVAGTTEDGISVIIMNNADWSIVPGPILRPAETTIEQVETCDLTTPLAGDRRDNDCDGIPDEDFAFSGYKVYSHDFDFDGGFGEDFLNITVLPGELLPPEPDCLPPPPTNWSCIAKCQCKCSWVAKQKAYLNMTEEEKAQHANNKSEEIKKELEVKTEELSSTAAKTQSAGDERKSSATIGYLGISIFAFTFGSLFLMDISSLFRDMKIFYTNLMIGVTRLKNYIRGP